MKITVTKSQLKQLVKEQAARFKKIYELEQKRETIKQQLKEGENMMGGTGVGLQNAGDVGKETPSVSQFDVEEGFFMGEDQKKN